MQKDFETEYVESCFGRNDEDNTSNCAITAVINTFWKNPNTDEFEFQQESIRHTVQAEFNLESRGDYASVDLTWPSSYDPDLRTFWNLLEDYGKKLRSVFDFDNPAEPKPIFQFIIISNEKIGEGYIRITNPLFWALTPVSTGSEDIRSIRLFINTNSVDFFKTNKEIVEKELHDISAAAGRQTRTILTEV